MEGNAACRLYGIIGSCLPLIVYQNQDIYIEYQNLGYLEFILTFLIGRFWLKRSYNDWKRK